MQQGKDLSAWITVTRRRSGFHSWLWSWIWLYFNCWEHLSQGKCHCFTLKMLYLVISKSHPTYKKTQHLIIWLEDSEGSFTVQEWGEISCHSNGNYSRSQQANCKIQMEYNCSWTAMKIRKNDQEYAFSSFALKCVNSLIQVGWEWWQAGETTAGNSCIPCPHPQFNSWLLHSFNPASC